MGESKDADGGLETSAKIGARKILAEDYSSSYERLKFAVSSSREYNEKRKSSIVGNELLKEKLL